MSPYLYASIDSNNRDIRLMTLLPGPPSSKICVTLETCTLFQEYNERLAYSALSYVWGSASGLIEIAVGGTAASALLVTQNLHIALQDLRYYDRPRVLWVDSICINQQDLRERSEQVEIMADIFKNAEFVIAYLGPEAEKGSLAILTLNNLSTAIQWDRVGGLKRRTISKIPWAGKPDAVVPYNEETWSAIHWLLNRPWFERLWTRQEIYLGRASSVFVCGKENITRNSLFNTILCLLVQKRDTTIELSSCLRRAYDLLYPGWTCLPWLISGSQDAKCTDPRDRVYGLLGMLATENSIKVNPDYAAPVEKVYRDFVLNAIEQHQNLEILLCCGLFKKTGHANKLLNLPSWVPAFGSAAPGGASETCVTAYMSGFRLQPDLPPEIQLQKIEEGILGLAGVYSATVKDVRSFGGGPEFERGSLDLGLVASHIVHLAPKDILTRPYFGTSLLEAYCRTLCFNNFRERTPNREYLPSFNGTIGTFRKSFTPKKSILDRLLFRSRCVSDPSVLKRGAEPYLLGLTPIVRGKNLFTTVEGYIGITDAALEPGDEVCTFLGSNIVPFLLRSDQFGCHKLVGKCYVHGLMEGEPFLGPLGSIWQVFYQMDHTENGPQPSLWFRNTETGISQREDPRHGPLLQGWSYWLENEGNALHYFNKGTGEHLQQNPVMKTENLKARGADIRWFQLL